jgi:hypothetical protein
MLNWYRQREALAWEAQPRQDPSRWIRVFKTQEY